MKKYSIFVLLLAVTLLFSRHAEAVTHRFETFAVHGFSLRIPADWPVTVRLNEIIITSPDENESITFMFAHREGRDANSFAQAVVASLEGTEPVQSEDGTFDYEFTYMDNDENINIRTIHVLNLGIVMKSKSNFDNIRNIISTIVI